MTAKVFSVLVVLGLAAIGSACGSGSSTTSGATSVPSTTETTSPQPTVFRPTSFLPGMRVTAPVSGWFVGEDSPIEFKLYPPGHDPSVDSTGIRFWLDPHASTPCSDQDLNVSMSTPGRVVAWLRRDKNLEVSNRRSVTIAGHLAALRVDLNVASSAPKCSPGCPRPCLDYFLFHAGGSSAPYGTGRGELSRFYLAQIGSHVLLVGLDTPNRRAFNRLTPQAAAMVASLKLPDPLPDSSG